MCRTHTRRHKGGRLLYQAVNILNFTHIKRLIY
nr:MAG TPA: hypothetical protein [Caudoviricetes sp.]